MAVFAFFARTISFDCGFLVRATFPPKFAEPGSAEMQHTNRRFRHSNRNDFITVWNVCILHSTFVVMIDVPFNMARKNFARKFPN